MQIKILRSLVITGAGGYILYAFYQFLQEAYRLRNRFYDYHSENKDISVETMLDSEKLIYYLIKLDLTLFIVKVVVALIILGLLLYLIKKNSE